MVLAEVYCRIKLMCGSDVINGQSVFMIPEDGRIPSMFSSIARVQLTPSLEVHVVDILQFRLMAK